MVHFPGSFWVIRSHGCALEFVFLEETHHVLEETHLIVCVIEFFLVIVERYINITLVYLMKP